MVGRSDLVGKPVGALLLAANATVTICHSRTRDLAGVCRRADVLVAAVGVPELVRGDWVKQGAVVIDVGINRTDDGLRGDVDFAAAAERARLDHPGARRRRADDDRDAAAQHAGGGARRPTVRRLRRGSGSRPRAASRCSRSCGRRGTTTRTRGGRSPSSTCCWCCWRCSASPPPSCRRRGAARRCRWRPRSSPRRSASSVLIALAVACSSHRATAASVGPRGRVRVLSGSVRRVVARAAR